jgi:uncharacterized membrane protein YkvA (DUF1232 family)
MNYGEHFTDESFWDKVRRYALRAGRRVLEPALVLYYCFKDEDTPAWAKTVIVGALGYFVVPMDAIPDATPVVGFSDDLGALTVALGVVAVHIRREHQEKAKEKLRQWLGDEADDDVGSPTEPV